MAWKLKQTNVPREFTKKAIKKKEKRNLKRKNRGKGSKHV